MNILVKIFIFCFADYGVRDKYKAWPINELLRGNTIFTILFAIGTGLLTKISDRSIIEGIKQQDDKTLNWLYDNYFQAVSKHILQNSGTPDDVSDVFQDSIIILYNQIRENSLEITGDLKGYFFGIARNRWKEHLRVRRETTVLDEEMPDDTGTEEISDHLLERIVSRAFQKLKPDYQLVLKLYSEGNSYEDIATKLNLKSETNARRKKYLSKEALMELMKEDPDFQEYLRFRQ
jgi:RNA polymerase sigma factor (sigma-70 family)